VAIPQSCKSIGDDAFYGSASLATVSIAEGCKSIGQSAFRQCTSLTAIRIPPRF
jgi:hypothetical protein